MEDALNNAVCDGQVSLARAQRAIALDWETAEARLGTQRARCSRARAREQRLGSYGQVPGLGQHSVPARRHHRRRLRANSAGASVTAVAHYKTTDHELTAVADRAGLATVAYYISSATPGYAVTVDVIASAGARTAKCSTTFTPVD